MVKSEARPQHSYQHFPKVPEKRNRDTLFRQEQPISQKKIIAYHFTLCTTYSPLFFHFS